VPPGQIGTQLTEELSETHELCLLDRSPVPGQKSTVVDLSSEISGRMAVDTGQLGSFVAVRIGSDEPAPQRTKNGDIGGSALKIFAACYDAVLNPNLRAFT
jgi:hypothetical protein